MINKRVEFASIDEIRAHSWAGNHAQDRQAFNAIDRFVANFAHGLADRAEAIRIMADKGMGMGRDEHISDEVLVAMFLDTCD